MMRKIWILEGFVTKERLEQDIENARAEVERFKGTEHAETAVEFLKVAEKNLAKNPDGYWLGYQGRSNYKVFCYDSKQTMRNLKDRHMKWRVLKAEIPEEAKFWPGRYVNGIENPGVLRYLYATL